MQVVSRGLWTTLLAGCLATALVGACTSDDGGAAAPDEIQDPAPAADLPDPYLALHLPGAVPPFWSPQDGWPDAYSLQAALEAAVVEARAGGVSGNEIALDGTEVIYFLFGPDPQRLLELVDPVLRFRAQPPRGSYALTFTQEDGRQRHELAVPGPNDPPFPQAWTYGETWFWAKTRVDLHGARWERGTQGEEFFLVSGGRCAANIMEKGARGADTYAYQTIIDFRSLAKAEPYEERSRALARSCLGLQARDGATFRRTELENLAPTSEGREPTVVENERQLTEAPLCITSPVAAQELALALLRLAEICQQEDSAKGP